MESMKVKFSYLEKDNKQKPHWSHSDWTYSNQAIGFWVIVGIIVSHYIRPSNFNFFS